MHLATFHPFRSVEPAVWLVIYVLLLVHASLFFGRRIGPLRRENWKPVFWGAAPYLLVLGLAIYEGGWAWFLYGVHWIPLVAIASMAARLPKAGQAGWVTFLGVLACASFAILRVNMIDPKNLRGSILWDDLDANSLYGALSAANGPSDMAPGGIVPDALMQKWLNTSSPELLGEVPAFAWHTPITGCYVHHPARFRLWLPEGLPTNNLDRAILVGSDGTRVPLQNEAFDLLNE